MIEEMLMEAVEAGKSEAIATMIGLGANFDHRDQCGNTVFMRLIETDNSDIGIERIAIHLLKYDLDVNAENNSGKTALLRAVEKGYPKLVKLLLDHGADYVRSNPQAIPIRILAV